MTHMFVSTDQNFALRPIHLAASMTSVLRWFPEISNETDLQKNLCFSLSLYHPLQPTLAFFQCSLSHLVSLNWWHLHLSCSISQKPSSHQWHISLIHPHIQSLRKSQPPIQPAKYRHICPLLSTAIATTLVPATIFSHLVWAICKFFFPLSDFYFLKFLRFNF